MEANFILKTTKFMLAFWGPVPAKRLQNMFIPKDPLFLRAVQLVLGEEVAVIGHRYRTRVDIYALIMAWGLKFGYSCVEEM